MDECYREQLKDMAIFSSVNGPTYKASAEYDVHGTYLKTDGGLPEVMGQKYVIRAGSFFEIKEGQIFRVAALKLGF